MTPTRNVRAIIVTQFQQGDKGNSMTGLAARYGLTVLQVEAIIRRALKEVPHVE